MTELIVASRHFANAPKNCFVRISGQTAIISNYGIKLLVFITEKGSVYCAVRAKFLNEVLVIFSF